MDKDIMRLLRGELIGQNIRALDNNLKGKVIDETKDTIVIETISKQRKLMIKKNNKFEFCIGNRKIQIHGKDISVKPEDRIKMKVNLNE